MFRIFAGDTNIFASSHDAKGLETLINVEIKKDWCDINKLSINLSKTNYLIVKSSRKRNHEFIVNIQSSNDTLKRKDVIKYLGAMLDESVFFNYHIAYVCSRMPGNLGIISKSVKILRNTFSIKKNYCSLIYPYASYSILAWGRIYKTFIQKVHTKQNHAIR